MSNEQIIKNENYYTIRSSLAKIVKKTINDFCANDGNETEIVKSVKKEFCLIALGDLRELGGKITEICDILDIDKTKTSVNDFLGQLQKKQ